jgi:hypothetical protein
MVNRHRLATLALCPAGNALMMYAERYTLRGIIMCTSRHT